MDDSGESSQAERWRVVCRGVGGTSAGQEALMKDKGGWVALLLFYFAFGCGILIFALWEAHLAWQSRSWPRVAGVVKSAKLVEIDNHDGSSYKAEIRYEFRLDGRIYTGDRVRSYTGTGFLSNAQVDLRKYRAGSKVTVYYNPRDPSNCRLEPGLHSSNLFLPLVGLFVTAIPCVIAHLWSKKADRMTVAIPWRDPSVSAWMSRGEAFGAASASPLSHSTIAEPPAAVVATSEDGHRVQIRFEGGRAAFAPGEAVAVRMHLDPETASSLTSLDLEWRWQTEGKGTEDVGVFHSEAVPVDRQAGQARFAFKSPPLPPTPWSYEGKLLTIRWGVRLRLGVEGRRRKLEADLPFVLRGDAAHPAGASLAFDGLPNVPEIPSNVRPGTSLPHRLVTESGGCCMIVMIVVAFLLVPTVFFFDRAMAGLVALGFLIAISYGRVTALGYATIGDVALGFLIAISYGLYCLAWIRFVEKTWIELGDHPLWPGASSRIAVGHPSLTRFRNLRVTLRQVEEVHYFAGSSTTTEKHTVHEARVLKGNERVLSAAEPLRLSGSLQIPGDTMHSFTSEHNRIRWYLVVEGKAGVRRKFERDFDILVYPFPPALAKTAKKAGVLDL